MKLLLLSTGGRPSRLFRHAREELVEFLAGRRLVGFVTAANLNDEVGYFASAQKFFRAIGVEAVHIQWQKPSLPFDGLEAIIVGGGNTYALLERLRASGLLERISGYVRRAGTPYIGASAGSNIVGPNILTTNDWNVVATARFDALGFVPWNINPHYPKTRRDTRSGTRFGETRDQRIAEYHLIHRNPVVGIEESAMIWVDGKQAIVRGNGRVRWFAPGQEPKWLCPGDHIALE